jgi:hypothetical protein
MPNFSIPRLSKIYPKCFFSKYTIWQSLFKVRLRFVLKVEKTKMFENEIDKQALSAGLPDT